MSLLSDWEFDTPCGLGCCHGTLSLRGFTVATYTGPGRAVPDHPGSTLILHSAASPAFLEYSIIKPTDRETATIHPLAYVILSAMAVVHPSEWGAGILPTPYPESPLPSQQLYRDGVVDLLPCPAGCRQRTLHLRSDLRDILGDHLADGQPRPTLP